MTERRLERFDIASELDGIPPTYNPRGYVWTAPRYARITHATFRAHRTKPDEIDLHAKRPSSPDGRVLRFKVPFIHTRAGAFFRPRPNDHRETRPVTPLRRTFFAFFLLRPCRAVGLHSSSNEMDSSPVGKITMCAERYA